jgi:hypothetical protein
MRNSTRKSFGQFRFITVTVTNEAWSVWSNRYAGDQVPYNWREFEPFGSPNRSAAPKPSAMVVISVMSCTGAEYHET